MTEHETLRLALGAIVAAGWQAIGHWQPWARPDQNPNVRERIFAYVWGVTGILLGIWIALGWLVALIALGIAAAAGIATVVVYVIDHFNNLPAREAYRDPKQE